MWRTELRLIREVYNKAVQSVGKDRLEHFTRFEAMVESFASEHLYGELRRSILFGPSFGGLMHNFCGSLNQLRLVASNRTFLASPEGLGVGRVGEIEVLSDRCLVRNGADVLQLLRSVHTRTEGNDTEGALPDGFVGQSAAASRCHST